MHRKITHFQLWARFKTEAVAERARWPLWLPVMLGAGIGLYFALPFEPPLAWGWTVAGLFAALGVLLRRLHRVGYALLAAGACALALGVGVAGVRTWSVSAPMLSADIGPVTLTGQVQDVEIRTRGQRLTLSHLIVSRLGPAATPERVRVTLQGAQPPFQVGDWLQLRAKLTPPSAPAAPGAFDFQRQSYFQGLGGVGFAFGRAQVIGAAPERGAASLAFAFERLRGRLAARVRAQIAGAAGEVATALTTGARGGIPQDVLDAMRASGLAHLLAISGLHVGLVTGIVFFAVRAALALVPALALRQPIKKWAAVAALSGALFYALIAGATVPTQRAFLMVALVLAAVLADRQALSMRTVAWAALMILVFAPEALLGASFQLSFAAVVALIAVFETGRSHPRLQAWFHAPGAGRVQRVGRYMAVVGVTTLVAGLATAAFAAFHFNRVADYSLAANLIAVPVTALWIMPWAVTAFALMPLGWEGLALAPMGWGVDVVLAVAREVAGWPGSQRLTPAFPTWGLVLFTLGGLWVAIWRRPWRRWGALPIVLGLASVVWMPMPDVLIDASGQLAAVKTPGGGYSVSTLRAKSFVRDVWLRRAGLAVQEGRWPRAQAGGTQAGGTQAGGTQAGGTQAGGTQAGATQAIRCDALGCVYDVPGKVPVAFVTAPEALAEDCASARVVVDLSGVTAGRGANPGRAALGCTAPVYIALEDLRRDGTHALTFTADGAVRVETVRQARGNRPWVVGENRD